MNTGFKSQGENGFWLRERMRWEILDWRADDKTYTGWWADDRDEYRLLSQTAMSSFDIREADKREWKLAQEAKEENFFKRHTVLGVSTEPERRHIQSPCLTTLSTSRHTTSMQIFLDSKKSSRYGHTFKKKNILSRRHLTELAEYFWLLLAGRVSTLFSIFGEEVEVVKSKAQSASPMWGTLCLGQSKKMAACIFIDGESLKAISKCVVEKVPERTKNGAL